MLSYRPIDLARDAAVVTHFAHDLFDLSFGDGFFVEQFGEDGSGFLGWVKHRQALEPAGSELVLLGDGTIGLVVTGAAEGDPAMGYVYNYYLIPAARGRGLGAVLDEYACGRLRSQGFGTARLSVTDRNVPAKGFYRHRGWTDAGPRPDRPDTRYMQKVLGG